MGMITAVDAAYDRMQEPSEVNVTVTEGGPMDDDLLAIRHVSSPSRETATTNGTWSNRDAASCGAPTSSDRRCKVVHQDPVREDRRAYSPMPAAQAGLPPRISYAMTRPFSFPLFVSKSWTVAGP